MAGHRLMIEARYNPGFRSKLMWKDVVPAVILTLQLGMGTSVASPAC
ncbi:MAG: hypothetical protein MK102_12955 [Fuerstiella sp.]|nr:hypothetical protein [Fuerstiella sp.]